MGSIFYYFSDTVGLWKSLVKFLAPLPGIAKIDIVKKFVLFDLDIIFNFVFICGIYKDLC